MLAGLSPTQPSLLLPSNSSIHPSFFSCSLNSLSPAASSISASTIVIEVSLMFNLKREHSFQHKDTETPRGIERAEPYLSVITSSPRGTEGGTSRVNIFSVRLLLLRV